MPAKLVQYQILAESIPQQVWTATPDGALDYVSGVVLRYFDQSVEAILGAGWQAVIHPEDLPACVERWRASLASGAPYEVEFRLRRHDGAYRWHLGRAVAERDAAGAIVRWFGTNTDIDEQRKAIRSRDDLLATVSHDLRGPLASIMLAAELLREDASPAAQRPLGVIERSTKRMEQLIQDLLDMASIEQGHLSVNPSPQPVGGLVEEAVDHVQVVAGAKGLAIETEVDGAPVLVACDRRRALQVFANMLGNAVKFTPPHGTIRVRATATDGAVTFSVSDTGPGIEPAQLPYVFDRFWQAKATARAGTGLGLAICKGIVQRHGGAIWVESPPGAGATFYFTLPIAA